uniref:regulator of nonsense transcripts 2 isoform X2 n=1 Tax=Myxine glutinosa TaxID=7769 RepID=UPI00358E2643
MPDEKKRKDDEMDEERVGDEMKEGLAVNGRNEDEAEKEDDVRKRELAEAMQLQRESMERYTWRVKERVLNQAAHESRPEEGSFSRLDSSLKKNTAFVRKLRTLTEQQRDALATDFNVLNLSKYITEAVSALVEARLKTSDVACAVHLCSLFHRRYAEFAGLLLAAWRKHLEQRREEKAHNVAKLRTDLRFIADIVALGIFTDKEGLSLLHEQLRAIVAADRDGHMHISVVISFCRHCGEEVAGIMPQKTRMLDEKYTIGMPRSDLFGLEKQQPFTALLREYYSSLAKHLRKNHRDLQNLERQNRRILHTKGELSEDRHKQHEEFTLAYQKLLANCQILAELLDENMPDLPEDKSSHEDPSIGIDVFAAGRAGDPDAEGGIWEDDDTRSFYENLVDLKAFVPAILFKDSEKAHLSRDLESKEVENVEELEKEIESLDIVEELGEIEDCEDEDLGEKLISDSAETEDEEASMASHMKMIVDAFLQQLMNCVNRDLIDKAATDFCMNMNTKGNRRKLVRALFTVPRQRLDLLPFFARLVATLHPCMPDVAEDLATMLKGDFRFHVRKKDQINIETKNKTVRFIGELTKFKVFQKTDTLQCLKMLLSDFSHHHIDMACTLLETCGRFLFRSPESHLCTNVLLEQMMRKKQAMMLDGRYVTLVENAYYYCNPPVVECIVRAARPPLHEYIRKLLYRDLSKATTEKVLRQVRKLPWADVEVRLYATRCLVSMWNVKYNNIHCVANLLAGLVPYQESLGVAVVDGVLEDVRLGMEINHPKFNQRRISITKFLGELYNYRMVESAVIFRTLYSFISFGVAPDGSPSVLDPPEHLFRIRLVCTLLDTCGQYFDRGSSKRKLDCFLVYFQRYVWWKKSQEVWNPPATFPIDVAYLVTDTLEMLRPRMRLCSSLEDASQQVLALQQEYLAKIGLGGSGKAGNLVETVAVPEEEDDDEDEEEGETDQSESDANVHEEEEKTENEEDEDYEDEDVANYQTDSNKETETDDDGGVTLKSGLLKPIACMEDDEFVTAFDKMMVDNIQQRGSEAVKVHQLDVPIPVSLKSVLKKAEAEMSTEADGDMMQFVMLTRKGNKQQLKTVHVPMTSRLAASRWNQQQAEQEERLRMKRLTLDINERQEQEDYQGTTNEMLQSMAQRPAQANTNRDRRPRYQHPKGAPNTDLIFKTGGRRR